MPQIQPVQPIDHLLFDLGVVLLNLDYARSLERVVALCDPSKAKNVPQVFSLLERDPCVEQHETGMLSAEGLYDRFVELTGFRGSLEEFAALWRDIFTENELMLRFAKEVAGQFDIYVLSNTGDLHVPYVFEAFPSLRFVKGWVASYQLKVSKPDPLFYEGALAQLGLKAGGGLFIDDRLENVEIARSMGIPSVHYTTPYETIAEIRERIFD